MFTYLVMRRGGCAQPTPSFAVWAVLLFSLLPFQLPACTLGFFGTSATMTRKRLRAVSSSVCLLPFGQCPHHRNLVYIPDQDKVYFGVRRRVWLRLPLDRVEDRRTPSNADLWVLVGRELSRRTGTLTVVPAESHVSVEDTRAGVTSHTLAMGNELAESLARRASDEVEVPKALAQEWPGAESLSRVVQDRLVQATIDSMRSKAPPGAPCDGALCRRSGASCLGSRFRGIGLSCVGRAYFFVRAANRAAHLGRDARGSHVASASP